MKISIQIHITYFDLSTSEIEEEYVAPILKKRKEPILKISIQIHIFYFGLNNCEIEEDYAAPIFQIGNYICLLK